MPAGYYRKGFAFQKWHHFDNRLWNQIVAEARENILYNRIRFEDICNLIELQQVHEEG